MTFSVRTVSPQPRRPGPTLWPFRLHSVAMPMMSSSNGSESLKSKNGSPYADAFALALAERLSVPLVTTDHHEFDAVERKGHVRFLWLR